MYKYGALACCVLLKYGFCCYICGGDIVTQ